MKQEILEILKGMVGASSFLLLSGMLIKLLTAP